MTDPIDTGALVARLRNCTTSRASWVELSASTIAEAADALSALASERDALRAEVEKWEKAAAATDIREYLQVALEGMRAVGPRAVRELLASNIKAVARANAAEARVAEVEKALKSVLAGPRDQRDGDATFALLPECEEHIRSLLSHHLEPAAAGDATDTENAR